MNRSISDKLETLTERLEEVGSLLSERDIIGDQSQFRPLSKEYAEIEPVVTCYGAYLAATKALQAARELRTDPDPDMRELADEEVTQTEVQLVDLEEQLKILLLPTDPADSSNIFLEIRAGTGGDEAALFAGDMHRMYLRYAEARGWQVETLSESLGEHGGYKEVISRVLGRDVYARLKFESGAHRVQRVPTTESQGRIHTSACTVAVLPEVDEISDIEIDAGDLRIDTYRASGAGGQHVNKTDSAIRITHLPTNTVVECQDERSQHKNRARAMSLLKARILDAQREKQRKEQAQERKDLVGSGDRSQRIRTYNFPQGRVTDHRINLTIYKLDEVLQGQVDRVIDSLVAEHQAEQLAALGRGDAGNATAAQT